MSEFVFEVLWNILYCSPYGIALQELPLLAPCSFNTGRLKLKVCRLHLSSIRLGCHLLCIPIFKIPLQKIFCWLVHGEVHVLKLVCCVCWKQAHMDVIGLHEICHRRGDLALGIVHDH